ncbi:hypothetical protein BJV82DRAFT_592313 [Fennellomyces sp. T-0311]|nr:hypothetical protein BJV82DRAFT_592313 [Fennellomyces sp. T-0311]
MTFTLNSNELKRVCSKIYRQNRFLIMQQHILYKCSKKKRKLLQHFSFRCLFMSLYQKLSTVLTTQTIDELGLVLGLPDVNELPPESQPYYPLIYVESKLGLPFEHFSALIRETDEAMRSTDLEQASKIMLMLKPDNYTAMNARKRFVASGQVTVQDEIAWIDLIFTIPKHCKSGVAWHHRQWLWTRDDARMDLDHELRLCTRTATLHPRNYYAWSYRRWLLETYMNTPQSREKEYQESRAWVERNVSDHSGVHHLAKVIEKMDRFDQEEHLDWINDLITRFPGHEALWCHRRFCFTFSPHLSSGHSFVDDLIKRNEDPIQVELALRFGLWLCLLNKQRGSNSREKEVAYASQLKELTSIPKYSIEP